MCCSPTLHVADVAVVGVPDEQWGEAVAAAVVAKAGASIDVQVLKDLVKEQLRALETCTYAGMDRAAPITKLANYCGGWLRHLSKRRSPEVNEGSPISSTNPHSRASAASISWPLQCRPMTTDAARNTDGSAGTGY